jgi:DNA modification methylase
VIVRKLFYGDNLDVMRESLPDGFADLIYLDPPFNSKKAYNAIFAQNNPGMAAAQIQAFDDTWVWDLLTVQEFERLTQGGSPRKVADTLTAFRKVLGESDLMAYLVMMTARLLEMHRVLKPTGSLYLHCDQTASHYLKVVLDAIFGPKQFRNEIIWHYSGWNKRMQMHFERRHDVLLFYGKSNAQAFNSYAIPWADEEEYIRVRRQKVHVDEEGRKYVLSDRGGGNRIRRYLDEAMQYGRPVDDVWDIDKLNNSSKEALGYPTQKPLALLRRIIQASSNPGDIVFDPFCGCGTSVAAAEELGRSWVGIDVAYIAIDLILKRLEHAYGEDLLKKVETSGIPRDLEAARSLHSTSHFEFERWAVSLVRGEPKNQPGGDKGVDGLISFYTNKEQELGTAIVEVKGGGTGPADVRSLSGAVSARGAEMGVFICMDEPTKKMREAANEAGTYYWPFGDKTFSRIVIITVPELLAGSRPDMPTPLDPYIKAARQPVLGVEQQTF